MKTNIKFSSDYPKLWNQRYARLIKVMEIDDTDINEDLIEYDTKNCNGKYYELPKGKKILLLFLGEKKIPFCTIRRSYPQKLDYYKSKEGALFDIEIKEEAEK